MIGARTSPGCELCKRGRQQRQEAIDNIPAETVAHIQSAGCKAQKKRVIGAHNRCWKYLLGAIFKHEEAKRDFEFIVEDKDRKWSHCGEKRESETSYHGRMLRMKRRGYLILTRLAKMNQKKITKMESRKRCFLAKWCLLAKGLTREARQHELWPDLRGIGGNDFGIGRTLIGGCGAGGTQATLPCLKWEARQVKRGGKDRGVWAGKIQFVGVRKRRSVISVVNFLYPGTLRELER
jgi:hypothetical protein